MCLYICVYKGKKMHAKLLNKNGKKCFPFMSYIFFTMSQKSLFCHLWLCVCVWLVNQNQIKRDEMTEKEAVSYFSR